MSTGNNWRVVKNTIVNLIVVLAGAVVGGVLHELFPIFSDPDINETVAIGFGVVLAIVLVGRWRHHRE